VDLNTVVNPNPPELNGPSPLTSAVAINDNGRIVANGHYNATPTFQQSFVLIPTPNLCTASATAVNTPNSTVSQYTTVGFTLTLSQSGGPCLAGPDGVVKFYDGNTLLGSVQAGSYVYFSTNKLSSGQHTITAQYIGNSLYGPATAAGASVNVTPVLFGLNPVSLSVAKGGFRYNPTNSTFSQILTLTNNTGQTITGPIYGVPTITSSGVTLANATGQFLACSPAGAQYVESAIDSLVFQDFSKVTPVYTIALSAGAGSQ
jgi:hypothetical protein